MDEETLEAYRLMGFSSDIPNETATYVAVSMESDYQPYTLDVDMYQGLVSDPHLGSCERKAYHDGLTDLMYKKATTND